MSSLFALHSEIFVAAQYCYAAWAVLLLLRGYLYLAAKLRAEGRLQQTQHPPQQPEPRQSGSSPADNRAPSGPAPSRPVTFMELLADPSLLREADGQQASPGPPAAASPAGASSSAGEVRQRRQAGGAANQETAGHLASAAREERSAQRTREDGTEGAGGARVDAAARGGGALRVRTEPGGPADTTLLYAQDDDEAEWPTEAEDRFGDVFERFADAILFITKVVKSALNSALASIGLREQWEFLLKAYRETDTADVAQVTGLRAFIFAVFCALYWDFAAHPPDTLAGERPPSPLWRGTLAAVRQQFVLSLGFHAITQGFDARRRGRFVNTALWPRALRVYRLTVVYFGGVVVLLFLALGWLAGWPKSASVAGMARTVAAAAGTLLMCLVYASLAAASVLWSRHLWSGMAANRTIVAECPHAKWAPWWSVYVSLCGTLMSSINFLSFFDLPFFSTHFAALQPAFMLLEASLFEALPRAFPRTPHVRRPVAVVADPSGPLGLRPLPLHLLLPTAAPAAE